LSGPNMAEEIAVGMPTAAVIASEDGYLAGQLQHALNSTAFRAYVNPDVVGVELCAAAKNVIALAAGGVDGLDLGDNSKAALITRGLAEMARLGEACGARPETFAGLAGMGDLIVTCWSRHGRNRHAGELIAQGLGPDALLTRLQRAFEKRGKVSWDEDVRPALGPELDLVALRGPPRQVVALTQPADAAKLHALLAKLGGGLVSRQIGGWTAIAKSADAFGALAHVTATLADAQPYQAATAELAPDALVHAYTDGSQARRLLLSLPGQAVATTPPARARFRGSGRGISTFAADRLAWGAADLVAANDGVRLHAYTRGTPPTLDAIEHARLLLVRTDPYVPLLVDEIPAGVLLVADYQAVSGGFENTPLASLPAWVRRLYAKQPGLPNDLDNLLGGETALYVRPGLPAPEITIVTQPPDVERAVEILPEVISALKDQLPLLGQITVRHAVIGGQLVIS